MFILWSRGPLFVSKIAFLIAFLNHTVYKKKIASKKKMIKHKSLDLNISKRKILKGFFLSREVRPNFTQHIIFTFITKTYLKASALSSNATIKVSSWCNIVFHGE